MAQQHRKLNPTQSNRKAETASIEKLSEQGDLFTLDEKPQVISMGEREALDVFRTFVEGKKIVQ